MRKLMFMSLVRARIMSRIYVGHNIKLRQPSFTLQSQKLQRTCINSLINRELFPEIKGYLTIRIHNGGRP